MAIVANGLLRKKNLHKNSKILNGSEGGKVQRNERVSYSQAKLLASIECIVEVEEILCEGIMDLNR